MNSKFKIKNPTATEGDSNSIYDIGLLLKALAFAAHKHRDQKRKDLEASPYINHPIALADVLCNEGGIADENVLCAALLHDTVEDTETTPEELTAVFGKVISDLVMELTDDKSLPKADRKRLQIEHAAKASRQAKLVKLADKICNLRDIVSSPPTEWDLTRKQEYFDWTKKAIWGQRRIDSYDRNIRCKKKHQYGVELFLASSIMPYTVRQLSLLKSCRLLRKVRNPYFIRRWKCLPR